MPPLLLLTVEFAICLLYFWMRLALWSAINPPGHQRGPKSRLPCADELCYANTFFFNTRTRSKWFFPLLVRSPEVRHLDFYDIVFQIISAIPLNSKRTQILGDFPPPHPLPSVSFNTPQYPSLYFWVWHVFLYDCSHWATQWFIIHPIKYGWNIEWAPIKAF